jgi:uncharacterized membrane protein YhhN
MIVTIVCMWLFVAAQIYFEYRHHQGKVGPYMGITKTIGSLLFVVVGILGTVHAQPGGMFLLTGIVLCVAGDVFLISRQRHFFLLGLVSFLLAHVAYCVAFIRMSPDITAIAIAAPVLLVVAFFILRWLMPHLDSKMKKPVLAYVVTICTMVALSAGVMFQGGVQFAVAAVVFMISDLFVARDRFVKTEFTNRLIGLPLYYGAQLIFAASLALTPMALQL